MGASLLVTAADPISTGKDLLKRLGSGEALTVPHATNADLGAFQAERSKCHENVDRWCREHPAHTPVRGWIITSGAIFDKHSVINRGREGLLDITPLDGRSSSTFLVHHGSQEEFDALPGQVMTLGN